MKYEFRECVITIDDDVASKKWDYPTERFDVVVSGIKKYINCCCTFHVSKYMIFDYQFFNKTENLDEFFNELVKDYYKRFKYIIRKKR